MSEEEVKLSNGVLLEIFKGNKITSGAVLQILRFQCLDEVNGELVYRLTLSDGENKSRFAVTGEDLIEKLSIEENNVIQLVEYECVKINNDNKTRNLLVVHDFVLVSDTTNIIGCPKDHDVVLDNLDEVAKIGQIELESLKKELPELEPWNETDNQVIDNEKDIVDTTIWIMDLKDTRGLSVLPEKPLPNKRITVTQLQKLQDGAKERGWVLRVRVINKLPIKSLFQGKGKIVNIDVADETGMIRACAFDAECEKFDNIFQIGCAYYIADAIVRLSNATNQKAVVNKLELKLSKLTIVRPCEDTAGLPFLTANFTPLTSFQSFERGSAIDVCGVCIEASQLWVNTDTSGCKVNHRTIHLVGPDTGSEINVSVDIWGILAEKFDASTNPVVVTKNIRVSHIQSLFGKRSDLFMDPASIVLIDPPDCPVVKILKKWFTTFKRTVKTAIENVEASAAIPEPPETISASNFEDAVKKMQLIIAKVFFIKTVATVIETDPQYLVTLACDSCKRQVYDLNLQKLVCSICGYVEGGIIRSLFTRVRLGNESVSEWVSISDAPLKKVLGIANNFIEYDNTTYWKNMKGLVGKQFHVQLKVDKNEAASMFSIVEIDAVLPDMLTNTQ